jgi:hypothetical protein
MAASFHAEGKLRSIKLSVIHHFLLKSLYQVRIKNLLLLLLLKIK